MFSFGYARCCRSGCIALSGIFFENFVANELIAKKHKLFYWRGKASSELEFIVESNNKIYPIDAKKGRGVLNSLEKFSNHNTFEYAIKVSKNNFGYNYEQKLLTVPFYFVPFVAKDFAEGTMADFNPRFEIITNTQIKQRTTARKKYLLCGQYAVYHGIWELGTHNK